MTGADGRDIAVVDGSNVAHAVEGEVVLERRTVRRGGSQDP